MKYWSFDENTREVNHASANAHYECGVYHLPKCAITFDPLPPKDGFVVLVTKSLTGTEYVRDYRGMTVFDCVTRQFKKIDEIGDIEDGFTLLQPQTQFDEWDGYQWVTNVSDKYIYDYNVVDTHRRQLYSQSVDPLMKEREIKLAQAEELEANHQVGLAADLRLEANDYKIRALQLRAKIQQDNPFPINPDAINKPAK